MQQLCVVKNGLVQFMFYANQVTPPATSFTAFWNTCPCSTSDDPAQCGWRCHNNKTAVGISEPIMECCLMKRIVKCSWMPVSSIAYDMILLKGQHLQYMRAVKYNLTIVIPFFEGHGSQHTNAHTWYLANHTLKFCMMCTIVFIICALYLLFYSILQLRAYYGVCIEKFHSLAGQFLFRQLSKITAQFSGPPV